MRVIDVNSADAVPLALSVIEEGGIIIYPTDTIYGFGVDAGNEDAIDKLNKIKGRQQPMSVLAPDKEIALSWGNISDDEKKMIELKLESKTTVIFTIKAGIVSSKILGEGNTLGVRIPENDFCNQISSLRKTPITTTSVNVHGQSPVNDPRNIVKMFGNKINLFIHSENLEGKQSSVVFKIYRGQISQIR